MKTRTLPSLITCALALAAALYGQGSDESDAGEVFFERLDVNVVNVEVYVTDKKGNRVTGLTKDDFELEVARNPVAITYFYAVEGGKGVTGGGEPVQTAEAADPRLASLQGQARSVPEDQRLHMILYVDNFNLRPFNRNRVLRQTRNFLRTRLRPGDQVMLVTYERTLHTRVNFTNDPELIASALFDIEEMSAHGVSYDSDRRDMLQWIDEAEEVHQVRGRAFQYAESIYNDMSFTLDALKTLVESLYGLPGRKAILHVSDGLSMRAGEDVFHAIYDRFPEDSSVLMDSHRYDLSRRFGSLTNQANASRVTFYTLEAAGLRTYSYLNVANRTPGGGPRVDQVHFSNLQSTLRFMARETGGMAFVNTNNYAPMLERMADDFDTYYSLGFSPAAAESGRFRRIKVTVKGKKGLVVRHREGYRDRSISTRMTDGTLAALHYGYQDNPLAVELEFGDMIARGKGQFVVPVLVRIPLGRLSFVPQEDMHRGRVRLFVGAKDSEGGLAPIQDVPVPIDIPRAELEQAMEQVYQYEIKLIMRGGRQVVAIGVRDEIGAVTGFVTRGVLVGTREG